MQFFTSEWWAGEGDPGIGEAYRRHFESISVGPQRLSLTKIDPMLRLVRSRFRDVELKPH